jgi:hypothetical protein
MFGAAAMAFGASPAKSDILPPTAPAVDFQVVLLRDTVNRGEALAAVAIIANKSNTDLQDLHIYSLNPLFRAEARAPSIPPFGSVRISLSLQPGKDKPPDFAQHRVLFVAEYQWTLGTRHFQSAQTAAVTPTVERLFVDEAKGLPGGTGALLYLLLPIMPAFLAFRIANGLVKGDGYVLPGFLLGLGVNFLVLLVARKNIDFAYTDPGAFAAMILYSVVLGAAIPVMRLVLAAIVWSLNGFHVSDTDAEYLRKALRIGPSARFPWATGAAGGQNWQGLLLKQPNGKLALGARIQVSPGPNLTADQIRAIFNNEGDLTDMPKMKRWLRNQDVTFEFRDRIRRGNEALDTRVVTDGLDGFSVSATQTRRLIEVVD